VAERIKTMPDVEISNSPDPTMRFAIWWPMRWVYDGTTSRAEPTGLGMLEEKGGRMKHPAANKKRCRNAECKSIFHRVRHIFVFPVLAAVVLGAAGCPNNVPVTGVTLNVTDWSAMNAEPCCGNYSYQLVATVHPANATNKKVTWASSDPANWPVDGNGLVVSVNNPTNGQGVMDPNLVVTVTTEDGGFTATCTGQASCPLLYVGNGKGKFTYLTDLQGPIIGMPGGVSIASRIGLFTNDYVVLDGLKPDAAGQYQVKLRELQAEIAYIDNVKVIPVDVPDGYDIASSSAEDTYGNGYVVSGQHFYTIRTPHNLMSAIDEHGADVTTQLKETDGIPAPTEASGLTSYTLDFGNFDAAHARLVVEAWALYSPTFGSESRIPPTISVKNAAGGWTVVKTVGVPAGDEKTMVFDLSGLFLTTDRHIRLNLGSRPWVRWVVDSIRLDDSAPITPSVAPEIEPATAELSRGELATFSLPNATTRTRVLDDNLPFNNVGLGQGNFTRYGDVRELLAATDDKFVVMGMGDQMVMTFGPLPPPQAGFHRILVMKILQYYKAPYVSTKVAELPFKGMTAYPYPLSEHYPNDTEHLAYLATYNTRVNK